MPGWKQPQQPLDRPRPLVDRAHRHGEGLRHLAVGHVEHAVSHAADGEHDPGRPAFVFPRKALLPLHHGQQRDGRSFAQLVVGVLPEERVEERGAGFLERVVSGDHGCTPCKECNATAERCPAEKVRPHLSQPPDKLVQARSIRP